MTAGSPGAIDAEALLSVPGVMGSFRASLDFAAVDISPDGTEVVFAWNISGTYELYTVALAGGPPRQLTDTPANARAMRPRYSPSGSHVAFLRDVDGDEMFEVWVVDLATGAQRPVTTARANREAIEWSGDSEQLIYRAHDRRGLGIWMVDVRSGEERVVVPVVRDPGSDHITPDLSGDGRFVVFHGACEDDAANVVLFVAPADGSAAPSILPTHPGAVARAVLPRWGPGDEVVAFTTDHRGRSEVALLPMERGRAAGAVTYLSDDPHDETAIGWGPTGRLLYRRSVDSTIQLRRHDRVTGTDEAIVADQGVCYSAADAPNGTVAYVWTSPVTPQELYTRAPGESGTARTSSLPDRIDPAALSMPDHVWYPGAGGEPIPALLFRPSGAIRGTGHERGLPPAVVWAHGGGTWQHLQNWDPIPQWLTSHGYAVLAPNARGSRGYGRAFREGNVRDWGGMDLEDHVRGADWLEDARIADGKRIGIYGSSGGGYMTSMAVTCAPSRWAAGVTSCGLVSLETFYRTTRPDLRGMVESYMGSPDEDPELFAARSPLTHIHKITAPLLVLHGGTDPRVPPSEAASLVEALERLGATYGYHVYPDEGHGFRSMANQADALRRILAWFDEHLTG
jgi:dipeptidyl aminopeptidase/acylaminoacyl peptidase